MSDWELEIPEPIRKAAAAIEIWFRVNGIEEWALMGIQSRNNHTDDTGKVLLTKEQQRDKAIEVLKYAASLCDSKNLSFKNAGYRAACDEIKVCLLASIERLESGERMEATAIVSASECNHSFNSIEPP